VLETIQETGERFGVVTRVARRLGIATGSPALLGGEGRDRQRPPGVTTEERRRIAELEPEHRELRRANEIPKEECNPEHRCSRPAV
jgi:transposase-like protein